MKYLLFWIISIVSIGTGFAQLDYPFSDGDTILTDDVSYVVWQGPQADWEPLRNGAAAIAEGLGWSDEGIFFDEIDSTQSARDRTSSLISTIVNYALAIVGLVALAYLLYHGFLALTAWSNSEQLNKWMLGIKYAFFALVGIGTAWFMISLILRFITLVTT
jgi:hypothetical protein